MTVIHLAPHTDPRWQRLIADHPYSSVFHTPQWLRALADTYGFAPQAYVLAGDEAATPSAGIAFFEIDDVRGKRVVSIPFSDFCDPLVRDAAEWEALCAPLLAKNLPVVTRCLHNPIPLDDAQMPVYKRAKWHGIALDAPPDTLWAGFNPAVRRAIRKAEKAGVVVREAGHDDLRAFFEMHLHLRKYKYRLLAQPYAFFENIWQQLIAPGQGLLMVACADDRRIGYVMYLKWRDTLTYKFSVSAQDALAYRPTDLLIWEGVRYAHAQGFRWLDLGLSDWDQEGLVRFKRKFAPLEKTLSFLRYSPANPAHDGPVLDGLLPRMTELFTDARVDDAITEEAGALLYRLFT